MPRSTCLEQSRSTSKVQYLLRRSAILVLKKDVGLAELLLAAGQSLKGKAFVGFPFFLVGSDRVMRRNLLPGLE
jgi:hypothetical protein